VLDRLHDATLRVQLPLVLAAIPTITALYAFAVVPVDTGPAVLLVASVAFATLAAGLLLRGSIRTTVEQLQGATDAIARGDFRHRIHSARADELGSLAASIDCMAERLERLEHARRRMLACVSHELRTPLTIIQGHAFTLARHECDVIRRERLELVQAEATRLAGLIGELVEAASLHAGGVRLRVERCDLVAILRDEVERFEDEAEHRDLRIELRAPARLALDADPMRVGQVVANLLANALRHAEPGSVLAVEADEDPGGMRRVRVINRCEPIPADIAARVFEPFVQGSARSGSVGLGLAIVQALVDAHGGSVSLDAAAAATGLARFTILLPAPSRVAPQPARSERPLARRAVIVPPSLAVES
jgi:signal transduction histidine kinase